MAPRTALPLPPTLPGSEPDPPPPDIAPRPDKHVQFRASSPPITSSDHSTQQEIASPSNQDDLARSSSDHSTNMREAEESPLLPSQEEEEHAILPHVPSPSRSSSETWIGQDTGEGESKSSLYLFLLTIAFGGLQIAWSVELSNGSPYLLSLGISKSLLAFVWIAGPLSGTLVSPYIGIQSDRCRSRFGKRRPFMVGGSIATIISLLTLAWAREIVGGFLSIFGVARDSQGTKTTTIVLAILLIYVLDFSINVVQAALRAFAVDNAPTHQQDAANAWAGRLLGIGNIIGYLFGYANLPKYLWFFGDTQFKVLCVIACLGLGVTIAISCFCITERDPRLEGEPPNQASGVLAFFKGLWRSMRRLPPQIKAVCYVQLAAWIGWFPFLFYATTYVGELYVDPIFRANPTMTDKEIDDAWEHGTRVGTFALLVYSIVSFVASVALPWIVASSYRPPEPFTRTPLTTSPTTPRTPRVQGGGQENGYFALGTSTTAPFNARNSHNMLFAQDKNWLARWRKRVPSMEIPWLTLRRAWMISHVMFAILTWLTFAARSATGATIVIALIGIPWTMTMWAPFALIAAEISKRESIRRGLIQPPSTVEGELLASGEDDSDGADQAGVILGIHNVAIAAPQVLATLVSSAIFKALQKPRGTVGDNSVAWVLRFGGCLALVAAWLTSRVREEGDEEQKPR